MKKLATAIIAVLLMAGSAWGAGLEGVTLTGVGVNVPVPALACTGTGDSCTGDDDGSYGVGNDSTTKWTGSQFIADATATLCSLTLQMSENGTYAGEVTACIFSDDGAAKPSTSLGCATSKPGAADIPASVGDVTFTGLSAAVTLGTTYHVVIWSSTVDASNYVKWYYEDSDCVADGEESTRSEDGITWATRSGANALEFTSNKLE